MVGWSMRGVGIGGVEKNVGWVTLAVVLPLYLMTDCYWMFKLEKARSIYPWRWRDETVVQNTRVMGGRYPRGAKSEAARPASRRGWKDLQKKAPKPSLFGCLSNIYIQSSTSATT